jgi:hypothetical protein
VRGGLDDALDKLARRDELRRRAAGEANGTPPAVQELVEAIAAVVRRNPRLAVTVGVEGAGDPILLHFAVEDGVVEVSADHNVAARAADAAPASPRHADFDLDLEDAVEDIPYVSPPDHSRSPEAGQQTRRISFDDRDRYDPGTGYGTDPFDDPPLFPEHPYEGHRRFDGTAPDPQPHPFAATPPPPVPPQTTRRIRAEQHRAPEEPTAAERLFGQRGMPTPLPEPIPLKVDSEETEMAARRLAALLRDNPSLLRPASPD